MMRKSGFTLIELLIVVAIIAILAAIAIPNFLQAQTRAKVSRAQADMASLATALEAYCVDNNTYPLMRGSGPPWAMTRPEDTDGYGAAITADDGFRTVPVECTTPIAYMSSLPPDPFKTPGYDPDVGEAYDATDPLDRGYVYSNIDEWIFADPGGWGAPDLANYGDWRLCSIGPDGIGGSDDATGAFLYPVGYQPYDPTNGTVSPGDILRTQAYASGLKPGYSEP